MFQNVVHIKLYKQAFFKTCLVDYRVFILIFLLCSCRLPLSKRASNSSHSPQVHLSQVSLSPGDFLSADEVESHVQARTGKMTEGRSNSSNDIQGNNITSGRTLTAQTNGETSVFTPFYLDLVSRHRSRVWLTSLECRTESVPQDELSFISFKSEIVLFTHDRSNLQCEIRPSDLFLRRDQLDAFVF